MLLIVILFLSHMANACDLLEKYPHTGSFILSSGTSVPTPTHSQSFDTFSVYGFLDYEKTAQHLNQEGFTPFKMSGRAVGVFSIYDYKNSDIGPFRESYFVILTSNFSLYHEKVWSSTTTAALMSKEIWGIPSEKAEVNILEDQYRKHFSVAEGLNSIFEMDWVKTLEIPNPFAKVLFVYAVGPKRDGAPSLSSPVEACRNTRVSEFSVSKGDKITFGDLKTQKLFENLNFRPFIKEIGYDEQAVQFLPQ